MSFEINRGNIVSFVFAHHEHQVSEKQKHPNPLTNLEITEELLSLPIVKRLGLTKEQFEELVTYIRKNLSPALSEACEQGTGGELLAHLLLLEEDEWRAKRKDLTELFKIIFDKI